MAGGASNRQAFIDLVIVKEQTAQLKIVKEQTAALKVRK